MPISDTDRRESENHPDPIRSVSLSTPDACVNSMLGPIAINKRNQGPKLASSRSAPVAGPPSLANEIRAGAKDLEVGAGSPKSRSPAFGGNNASGRLSGAVPAADFAQRTPTLAPASVAAEWWSSAGESRNRGFARVEGTTRRLAVAERTNQG